MDDPPQIHIHGLELRARVGVTDAERATDQRLVLNITVWLKHEIGALEDDITRAADYATMAAQVRSIAEARADKLIETLADAIARHLLESFPIMRTAVEVRKFVLPQTDFVSVTVVRSARE